jgi:lysophospholipase L1-like esterase
MKRVEQNHVSKVSSSLLGWLLMLIASGLILWVLDIVFGRVTHVQWIRQTAHMFRSEATLLPLHTKNLVPNITHNYDDIGRPEGSEYLPLNAPRRFRTDGSGLILGYDSGAEAGRDSPLILFLGGSTTESNEVDEELRFPAVVQRVLSDVCDIPVRTWNSGVRGHTVIDSINLLLNHPSHHRATHVVLMHNLNDRLRLALKRGYFASLGTDAPTSWLAVRTSGLLFASTVWDFVTYRSNTLFALRMKWGNLNPFNGEENNPAVSERVINIPDSNLEASIETFRSYLRLFSIIVKSLDQSPVLMTQPLGQASTLQERFNAVIREVAFSQDIPVVDLSARFPSDHDLFLSDKIHFSNKGAITAGNLIASEIAPAVGCSASFGIPKAAEKE